MNWYKIKLDKADIEFSKFIRLRDKKCKRCGKSGIINSEGLPICGLQASHFYSRRNESTRFDPDNVDALCANCHRKWSGEERKEYEKFKIDQLGKQGFDELTIKANTYQKKDRKMAYMIAKKLLEDEIKKYKEDEWKT